MVIWSLLSIFGLWIAHRTLLQCESLQMFTLQKINQLRWITFLTVLGLNFLFRTWVVFLIPVNIVIFLSPLWCPRVIEWKRESLLKTEFIPIVDALIISMKSGKGFRPAFMASLQGVQRPLHHILGEFLSALQYQKDVRSLSSDSKIQFFFRELSMVDQAAHKPVDRLKALRRRLMMEKNFRLKSRQALMQVRLQSWIISAMYALVLLYVQHDFGLRKHAGLVFASAVLFGAGLVIVQKMGRNYRWKI